jgi:hypothetical protein
MAEEPGSNPVNPSPPDPQGAMDAEAMPLATSQQGEQRHTGHRHPLAAPGGLPGAGNVMIGIQLPPDAAAGLAQSHPVEMLELAKQVDNHGYTLAEKRQANSHERARREQEIEFELEKAEIADRKGSRAHTRTIVIIALIALLGLLIFGGVTGNEELVGEWIEKFFTFALGALGGAGGLKLYQHSQGED